MNHKCYHISSMTTYKKNCDVTKHETWNCVDQILLENPAVITLNKKYATLFITSKTFTVVCTRFTQTHNKCTI